MAFWVSGHKPCWFSKSDVMGIHLLGAGLKTLSCDDWCGAWICHSLGRSCRLVSSLPYCELPHLDQNLWWVCISASPACLFLICETLRSSLASFHFFRENCSICSSRFNVSVRGDEFRIFLHYYLKLPPYNSFICKSPKQLKFQSTCGWLLIHPTTWKKFKIFRLSERSQIQDYILYDSIYIKFLENTWL